MLSEEAAAFGPMGLGGREKTEERMREETLALMLLLTLACVNGGFLSNRLETKVWEQGEHPQAGC